MRTRKNVHEMSMREFCAFLRSATLPSRASAWTGEHCALDRLYMRMESEFWLTPVRLPNDEALLPGAILQLVALRMHRLSDVVYLGDGLPDDPAFDALCERFEPELPPALPLPRSGSSRHSGTRSLEFTPPPPN